MENKNLTALISAFARSYHYETSNISIIHDRVARKIFPDDEYEGISNTLTKGISFFNPDFKGNDKEALNWIINNNLAPIVLARTAFTEHVIETEKQLGLKQYLVLASGYDTSIYYNKFDGIKCFELDKEAMIIDKKDRLSRANIVSDTSYIPCDFSKPNWVNALLDSNYSKDEKSLCTLLGLTYYLTKTEFSTLLNTLSNTLTFGSTIIFDYPTNESKTSIKKIEQLAYVAKEQMQAKYSYKEIIEILENNNFLVYEHLTYKDIEKDYFNRYNSINPRHRIEATPGINYVMAVKR